MVLHVHAEESVSAAIDSARSVYAARGEKTTILIEPGTYREEITIDVPGLSLKNASRRPSIGLKNHGVDCDGNAVRLSWYYGHGYQYRSMGERVNYGGSRERRWNASVLVTAPDFYAENIIFENSFNLYVCDLEAADSLVDISQSDMPWTEKERPKKVMPVRPKETGCTDVQQKRFRERAAAISFTETATNARLKNCRAVGRQDVLYGDEGASIYWQGGILQGGVDFIFGAMTMAVDKATIVANINNEKNDKCYISAGRSGGETAPANSRGALRFPACTTFSNGVVHTSTASHAVISVAVAVLANQIGYHCCHSIIVVSTFFQSTLISTCMSHKLSFSHTISNSLNSLR